MLSSPPPLPHTGNDDDMHSLSLSRNPSVSLRASTIGSQNIHSSPVLDWPDVSLKELTEKNKLVGINTLYSVQAAFETLVSHNLTSVPVANDPSNDLMSSCQTFDYSDLITHLLLITNKVSIGELNIQDIAPDITDPAKKLEYIQLTIACAKRGAEVPVDFILKLRPKNPLVKFKETETLVKVMEVLGNGVHRIAVTDGKRVTGILSQRRLIKYMWENARRFPLLDFLLQSTIQDLKIGSSAPITIYEDQLLIDALRKMFDERVSSLAVIDRSRLLIGNISITDVKNVTSSKNSHLLYKSVLNFISYNLTQKGIEEGQDQFPIFHVNNQSSLGRVIAKLVATQSHRLWIVDDGQRHSSSVSSASSIAGDATATVETLFADVDSKEAIPSPAPPVSAPSASPNTAPPKNVLPHGGSAAGKLIGVVTLSDILGLFARSKGSKSDPQFARNQRRRSLTSTTRSSIDSTRDSFK